MTKNAIILFFLCSINGFAQQTGGRFNQFKNRFEQIHAPFNFSHLNKHQILIENSKKIPLTEKEILQYVLGGNKAGLEYKFEKYDMETGESKGIEKSPYKFYPVYRIDHNNLLILVILRTSIDRQAYLLSAYNISRKKTKGATEINTLDAEDEYRVFQSSYLDEEFRLKTFRYEINPEYLKNIRTETNRSILTEVVYQFNDDVLQPVQKNTRKSKCSVADFYQKQKPCIDEDPMKDLPLLNSN